MTGTPRQRGDTKTQIVDAAMRLFAENGYDKTSLREIAEVVGVTKAALYYHFRTKEDIVGLALQGYIDRLTGLIDRAEASPAGPERNASLIDGLLELFTGSGGVALRFGQANPTVMSQLHIGESQIALVRRLVGALSGDDAPPEAGIRATLAFGALVIGVIGNELTPLGAEPAERSASGRHASADTAQQRARERAQAGRTVALELLAPLTPPAESTA